MMRSEEMKLREEPSLEAQLLLTSQAPAYPKVPSLVLRLLIG